MKTVLVAVGLPIAAGPTLDTAVTLARALGARLVAFHVVQPPSVGDTAAASEHAAQQLAGLQRRIQQRGITIETRHVVGDPGRRIVEMATLLAATYVVMGRPSDNSPGAVVALVLREAPCPAVIVPANARR